jgi:hypothetical protein
MVNYLTLFMFLALRLVTLYIPTTALELVTVIYKHVLNLLHFRTFWPSYITKDECTLCAFIHGDINSYRRHRDLFLKTKTIFCNRFFFGIQIITFKLYILYYIFFKVLTILIVIFELYYCTSLT